MLFQYIAIAILLVLTTAVGVIAVSLGALFGPKRDTKRKQMPYESGMVPIGKGTRRMPVRFYLIAVLFILFDIEVIFFLPWAVSFRKYIENGMGTFIFLEMLVFIGILLVGYVYAWKKGAFEWE
ncbi:MAG: NADH-quinone oxidoreductase subunit A [Anaerolineae bacterium]|jgi:NADH-quinone oxidoreductase subunit A|nr:NADH-quinone oxidoreductase subunit A [Anaerolineae bacterium]MBT3712027.1 NADH-quinone oxidoreductase subunit A [Anaerolineae bacterium]MBT4309303.1 NADH-quinone oxidoreductase subunit A [Anaerolineae bacterium]MBT4460122.1 NADH-quinone oxidoreductase subunit A [Anaerolineae bacterium]MBT4842987.1 NADH-quinone oxidoreductase subunit A [Anaerolineae bacterium]